MSTSAAAAAAAAPAKPSSAQAPLPKTTFKDLSKVTDLDKIKTAVEKQKKELAASKQAIEENERLLNGNLTHLDCLVTAKQNADAQAKRKREAEEKAKKEAEEKAKKEDEERERKRVKILERMKRDEEALKALEKPSSAVVETPSTAAVTPCVTPTLSDNGKGKGNNAGKEYKCRECHKPIKEHTPMEKLNCAEKRQLKKEAKEAKKVEKPEKDEKTDEVEKPKKVEKTNNVKLTPRAALDPKPAPKHTPPVPKKKKATEVARVKENEASLIVEMQEEASGMKNTARDGPGIGKSPGGLRRPVEDLVSESDPESGSDLSSPPGSPFSSELGSDESQMSNE